MSANWILYCNTENKFVTLYSETTPTQCPNDINHEINNDSVIPYTSTNYAYTSSSLNVFNYDYSSNTYSGITGPQGPQGPQGPRGNSRYITPYYTDSNTLAISGVTGFLGKINFSSTYDYSPVVTLNSTLSSTGNTLYLKNVTPSYFEYYLRYNSTTGLIGSTLDNFGTGAFYKVDNVLGGDYISYDDNLGGDLSVLVKTSICCREINNKPCIMTCDNTNTFHLLVSNNNYGTEYWNVYKMITATANFTFNPIYTFTTSTNNNNNTYALAIADNSTNKSLYYINFSGNGILTDPDIGGYTYTIVTSANELIYNTNVTLSVSPTTTVACYYNYAASDVNGNVNLYCSYRTSGAFTNVKVDSNLGPLSTSGTKNLAYIELDSKYLFYVNYVSASQYYIKCAYTTDYNTWTIVNVNNTINCGLRGMSVIKHPLYNRPILVYYDETNGNIMYSSNFSVQGTFTHNTITPVGGIPSSISNNIKVLLVDNFIAIICCNSTSNIYFYRSSSLDITTTNSWTSYNLNTVGTGVHEMLSCGIPTIFTISNGNICMIKLPLKTRLNYLVV